jgi:hypothetical protein
MLKTAISNAPKSLRLRLAFVTCIVVFRYQLGVQGHYEHRHCSILPGPQAILEIVVLVLTQRGHQADFSFGTFVAHRSRDLPRQISELILWRFLSMRLKSAKPSEIQLIDIALHNIQYLPIHT